jgi:hypothetical protein
MEFRAVSYAYRNISTEILNYQKKVFEHFNLEIEQHVGEFDHGQFLQHILKEEKTKYTVFFDVDCIPLASNLYDIIQEELTKEECILGIEQTGMPRYHIYAGPACLALSSQLYKKLESPSLNQNFRSDVAEELTWRCEERAIKVKYFTVGNVEHPKWRLGYDRSFGIGTTYTFRGCNVLYHQFEIRNNSSNFIDKCKNVLSTRI